MIFILFDNIGIYFFSMYKKYIHIFYKYGINTFPNLGRPETYS